MSYRRRSVFMVREAMISLIAQPVAVCFGQRKKPGQRMKELELKHCMTQICQNI